MEIAARIADLRALLPARVARPLVALEMRNDMASVISYLAMLDAGWPVIVLEPGAAQGKARGLVERYGPNLLLGADGGLALNTARCAAHEDLALLLSTSGTTGAAKLVRLSKGNIASNARAIAQYLGLSGSERAITTLPLHYSYGLSVLHAHLFVGAPVFVTERSVTGPEFWQEARAFAATSLALVPAQAQALDPGQLGPRLPSLRYVTQAGGRLEIAVAQRYAAQSWRFYIMYGQTEAAPRMAYLPPGSAIDVPGLIGRAIPGGSFVLRDTDGGLISGTGREGELIYSGPNVMMGYAETRTDLSRSAELEVLRTGDLAERRADGIYRITGRKARFIKPFGLRIGLDEVEIRAQREAGPAYAVGTDSYLTVFAKSAPDGLAAQLATEFGLPPGTVTLVEMADIPLMPSGKPDYTKLSELAARDRSADTTEGLSGVVAGALRLASVDMSQSFRALGGDSLAYLQVQRWLASRGSVPDGWDARPLRDLQLPPKTAMAELPAELALRILAIFTVIALHATDLRLAGGTFILLILAGYSLARFQMSTLSQGRIGHVLRAMLAPLLLAYFAIIAGVHLLRTPVPREWFLLAANLEPAAMVQGLQPYWFVNAYAQVMVLACLPFALPSLRKRIVAQPFPSGLTALCAVALAFEGLALETVDSGWRQRHPVAALELIVIGWCVFWARDRREKAAIAVAVAAIFLIHWGDLPPTGAAFFLAGTAALLVQARLDVPAWLFQSAVIIGSATMLIYLLHPVLISVGFALGLPAGGRFMLAAVGSTALALCAQAGARQLRAGFGGTWTLRVKHWLNGPEQRD